MKVLVVEDSPGHALLVRELLADAAPGEFEVSVVGSLAETVAILLGMDRPQLDCILLDLGLPDSAGMQSFEQVRTAALDAPVVVHSGHDDDALALACVRAGAQDYLTKGATGKEIARALRHAAERKRRENVLARQALHDPLTGLPNRTLFLDRLRQALSRLGRTQTCLAVMFLDLDRFKEVNDRDGHAAGDALLRDVAERLLASLRGGDTAARIGGDEFVVLCEDIAGVAEARLIAGRVLDELPVPASMGVALAVDSAIDAHELVRDADAAMYAAKRRGGAGVQLAATPPTIRDRSDGV
jgi:diguanylate cyclase (GGDEF)-like protein